MDRTCTHRNRKCTRHKKQGLEISYLICVCECVCVRVFISHDAMLTSEAMPLVYGEDTIGSDSDDGGVG